MKNETTTVKTADLIIKPDLGEIQVNNKTLRLTPVNMKVLLMLVNQADRVVTRVELFDSIWRNQIISDDALTKSISEIRTSLAKHSHYKKLILTVPKKGYQWSPTEFAKPTQLENNTKPHIKELIKNTVLVFVSVMVLATSFLWVANKLVEVKYLPILLLPIESYGEDHQTNAINLEDSLRKNILTTTNIRFLSKSLLLNRSNNSQAQWAIEGSIRKVQEQLRYKLSLIDTKTSLEIYSQSIEFDNNEKKVKLDYFSLKFIKTIDQKIGY